MKPICIIRHVDYERLGWIPELLDELGLPYTSLSLALGEALPDVDDCGGVIAMGGPMSAYETDEFPWIQIEMDFARRVVAEGLPYLGICLGGQILAQAFGAEVRAGALELGWLPLEKNLMASEDPVFGDLEVPDLFQLHGDVFGLPDGATNLMSSTKCSHQAFRLAPRVYGLQFHPEANPTMLESVIEEYQMKLQPEQVQLMQDENGQKAQKGKEALRHILKRLFL